MDKFLSEKLPKAIIWLKLSKSFIVEKENLIFGAYLEFPIHFQNSGIFDTPFMIKVVFDPKHVTVSGKIIPLIHVDPIPFVGNNLWP